MKPYPLIDDLVGPVLRVMMPRAPRVIAPGGTMHVVTRCNNREFYFTAAADFELLVSHLRELVRTYEVTVYAYTLMSNHVHLLLQAPTHEALGRPLRWFMTETARVRRIRDVAALVALCCGLVSAIADTTWSPQPARRRTQQRPLWSSNRNPGWTDATLNGMAHPPG